MNKNTTAQQPQKKPVPELRFKEFDGAWVNNRLYDLSSLITKGTTPKSFTAEGVNYVKIEGLQGVHINKEKCLYISEEVHLKELKRSVLKDKDLLFAIAGATVGKVGIVTPDILPANTNQALAIIRLKDTKYLNYILQILQSRVMKKYIYQSVSVGAQPNLNLEQIGNFRFNLPSLPEQKKIATFLSAVDQKIQQLTKKATLLAQYKKGVMQQLFSGELRFRDDNGAAYPDWETNKFSKYIKLYRGSSPRPIIKYVTADENGVNWIKIGDTKHSKNYRISKVFEKITKEGSLKSRYVEKGEIILANSMSFGKSYLLELEGCIYDGWFVLRGYEAFFDKEFLLQVLNSTFLQKQYFRLSTGGVVQNISSDIVYSTVLICPSLPEQQKIANYLSSIDTKIEHVKQQITQTQSFKKGLLQQLFV